VARMTVGHPSSGSAHGAVMNSLSGGRERNRTAPPA
jgi:hypothetical protein